MKTPSLRSVLLSLPQPVVVSGSVFLFANADRFSWVTNRWHFAFALMMAPLLVISVVERFTPRRKDWLITKKEAFVDAFWVIGWVFLWGELLSSTYDTYISEFFYAARETVGLRFSLDPSAPLGIVLCAVFAALFIDLIIYWIHVAQHRIPLLWRTHATHHHIPKFSVAKSDRNHPLETLPFNLGHLVVLAFLDANAMVIGAYFIMQISTTYFAHCNLPLVSGVFGWVFATPIIHQVHHSCDPVESNMNYGCVFSIWDRVFGTFSGQQTIERAGNGTGKELSILSGMILPFRSTAVIRSL